MSIDVVELVMQELPPDVIGQIDRLVGVGQPLAERAATAMVPAMLAGLAAKAAMPEGARRLADELDNLDPELLDKLGGLLAGPEQETAIGQGTAMLGRVLGPTSTQLLAKGVAKYAGISEKHANTQMGILAPVVMGSVAQYQQANDLDAGGLASLLAGQKDVIAQTTPDDLVDDLHETGWFASEAGSAGRDLTAAGASGLVSQAAARLSPVAGDALGRASDLIDGAKAVVDQASRMPAAASEAVASAVAKVGQAADQAGANLSGAGFSSAAASKAGAAAAVSSEAASKSSSVDAARQAVDRAASAIASGPGSPVIQARLAAVQHRE